MGATQKSGTEDDTQFTAHYRSVPCCENKGLPAGTKVTLGTEPLRVGRVVGEGSAEVATLKVVSYIISQPVPLASSLFM